MSCGSAWYQNHVPFLFNTTAAVFKPKDGSASLQPCPPPRNEFNMSQGLHLPNHLIPKTECRTVQSSLSVTHHMPGRVIQGMHPPANQSVINAPYVAQNSILAHNQPFSNGMNGIPSSSEQLLANRSGTAHYWPLQSHRLSSGNSHFQPVADLLSGNGPSISHHSHPQICPPHSNGIGLIPNPKVFTQNRFRSSSSVSRAEPLPEHLLSPNESGRTPAHQQPEKESIEPQGLRSIFENPSGNRSSMPQNPHWILGQWRGGSQSSHPPSSKIPETSFNANRKHPLFETSWLQNQYPQYTEDLHICIIGPPNCGKAYLIRAFSRNNNIRILKDKPLSWVFQQGMASFGTTLKINIWYVEDPTSAAENLRSLCESSKSVLFLVYNAAEKSTLIIIQKWIQFLKSAVGLNVPIILIGNTTEVFGTTSNHVLPFEGFETKEKFGLADFYECSTKNINEVELVILMAALKAFHRKIPKS